MPLSDPTDLLAGQRVIPSEMRSAQWGRVDLWTRERAFWMAGVTRYEIVQEMREMVGRAARGEAGEFELRKEWEAFLDRTGYRPEPGQEGTIKDLRSLRRFNVALRTNLSLMSGWAQKQNGRQPGPLRAQPAYELVRVQPARVPRDWPARWAQAGGEVRPDGRMIAPKLSPVWRELGDAARYPDALGVDYPPFAWGSGMDWRLVGAREAMELGVMTREQIQEQVAEMTARPPVADSPNAGLETRPRITEAALREAIEDDLGGLGRWDGDIFVFTDPNGTRPMTQAELLDVWSRPLPARFHRWAPDGHLQRQALIDWVSDHAAFSGEGRTDEWHDLLRLIARLSNTREPERLWRGLKVAAADVDRLVEQWREHGYTLKGDLPAESWTDSPRAAGRYAAEGRKGKWSVIVENRGSGGAKDISALVRALSGLIRKKSDPSVVTESEWLMPAGTRLDVVRVVRDAELRVIRVITTDAGSIATRRSGNDSSAPSPDREDPSPRLSAAPPAAGGEPSASSAGPV